MQVGEFCRGQRKDEDILLILDQDGALELLNDRADPLGTKVGGVLTGQLPRDRLDNAAASFRDGGGAVLGSRGWRKRQSEDEKAQSKPEQMLFMPQSRSCHARLLCGMSKRTQHSHVCWRARLLIIVMGSGPG